VIRVVKILVWMVVNVYRMEPVDLHVIAQIHLQDNDVKIVCSNKSITFDDHKFLLQVLILVPVNHVVMVALVDL
jgi:hypothetical protein